MRLYFLVLPFVLFAAAPLSVRSQETKVIDEIVALVDNQILLRSDVDGFLLNVLSQSGVEYTPDLWTEALDQLIDQKVLASHARRDTNLIISDDQLDAALNDRVSRMSAQVGGERRLEDIYGKTIIEIKTDLREDFRDQMLAEQFQSDRVRKIRITPSEVRQWFEPFPADSLPVLPEAVRISHIVRFPDVTDEARQDAREVIQAISDSIAAGSEFEDMARRFSSDPGSASRGGLYEGAKLATFVPEFAAVASRTEIGKVSQIFETEFGLHILRVNSRRGDVVDLNQILIQFDRRKSDPTAAIEFLTVLRDSVANHGADFSVLARRHSEEKQSASLGGRVLDPRTQSANIILEDLGPRWGVTLLDLEDGDVSEPAEVELLDGRRAYHIVFLKRRILEHKVSLDTDYEFIQNFALREKQQREIDKWLTELRKSVFIQIVGAPS